jgi:hypothetical protein
MTAVEEEWQERGMFLESIGPYTNFCADEIYQLTVVLPPGQSPRTIKVIVPLPT